MIQTKAVKATAKATLKGKWLWACVVSIIPLFSFAANYLLEAVASVMIGDFAIIIGTLLNIFLSSVLVLGALRVYWHGINGYYSSVVNVFYYFSNINNYKKAISFVLRIVIPLFLNAVLLFLPTIILNWLSSGNFFELFNLPIPLFIGGLKYPAIFFAVIAAILVIYKFLNVFVSAFLFVSNENMNAKECINTAIKISKKTKSMYVSHIFSFWFCILVSLFALPLVFTLPYLIVSYLVDCRFCVSYYNRMGSMQNSAPVYSC